MPIANYIDGNWTTPDAGTLVVENPATRERLGEVPLSRPADLDAAVQAARRAFPGWRRTPAVERARVLFRLKGLLDEHHQELAVQLTKEHGKNVAETYGEVKRGIENVEYACGIPTLMMGETTEDISQGIDSSTYRQPLGVVGIITPYNFPVMIPMWFWPMAVATGNTVVLKPSEQDPLTHQKIVELAEQAGLPAGVLNVVHGGSDIAEALVDHPDVEAISFVGSSCVAKSVYERAAKTGKRVQALGGAKNHMIVLPDADPDVVSAAITASVFGSAGQRCLAGSMIVGVGDAYDPMRERLLDEAGSLKVGNGLEEGVFMGPVISGPHKERVVDYIGTGETEGATLLMDGRSFSVDGYPDGHWVGPTVFEGVHPDMAIGKEEIFGPVMGLSRSSSLDDALSMIEKSRYGNATSLFTTSGAAAREFRYHAGISMIGINIGVAAPMAFFPFGGTRESFYGDLKAQGTDSVRFFTDAKVVISRW